MHDRCKETVKDIVERIDKGEFRSETDVRRGIVDPLLQELGWPVSRPRVVEREYSVEGGRVDYALCDQEKPLVFIEAKRPGGVTDTGRQQLFRYCAAHGVPIAALTDGRTWNFFVPLRRGTVAERRLPPIALSTDATEVCKILHRYLERRAVTSERNIEAAIDDLERMKFQATCESVWRRLVEGPSPKFEEMFAEQVWKKVPRRAGDDVATWIRLRAGNQPPHPLPAPPPPPPPDSQPDRRPPIRPKARQPKRYRLWGGEWQQANSWRDVLRGVVDALYRRHENEFDRALEMPWVTADPSERHTPYRIDGSQYFIELNVSAAGIARMCERLLDLFDHRGADLDID